MIYEFLKDFHRRAEIIAIVDFITTRVARKTKLREFEFDASETINLVMLVLCFIMEKSLIEEACTKNDVANYIRRLDAEFLKKNIPDEEYLQIVDYIIKDCLQNSGIPHYFSTYNFEVNREEKINVKLIDDKRISIGNDNVYTYYMTPQGYKFMFNTLEIEDALKVSIEQFKLNLSIKKRNFNAARNNADSLFNISKTQIQRINYFIKRVKEDIGSTGIAEYEKIYNSTFSSIDEQKEGYDNLYEMIKRVENSIIESNNNGVHNEVLKKEIEDISYIKNKLKFIINEQSNLLLKQQQLQKIYNEAVDNILYIGFESRINFEDVIMKRLEEDIELSYPLIKVLRPLFMPDTNKFFNIKMALSEQRIAMAETYSEGSNILMNEKYFNRFESERDIRIRDINKKYVDIFEIICKRTLENSENEVLLSVLINQLKHEYERFVPDLKILTNVLLQLCNIKEVDFKAIKDQKNKTVFSPSEAFDIKYCVLELLNRDRRYDVISGLKILLSRNKKLFIAEKPLDENLDGLFSAEKVVGLNCPDIMFKIEVNEH
ncbi:MAG: hypothetical protein Q8942_07385 [Bacillota bacterium]|nr:hypothetical protein [Bacillota bacterium]